MNILSFILQVFLCLVVLILIFRLSRKIVLGNDEVFDIIFNLINKCYGSVKQYFCKKGPKVNGDGRAIQDDREAYDSSSVWED